MLCAKYKSDNNKAYWLFGFIMFWLFIFVLHALITLMFYGPDYELALRFLSWESYLQAKVYFLSSALVASFFFGIFFYYLARDLKRDNSGRLYEIVKELVGSSEERVKDHVEEKFGQISMDQYELSKEFKVVRESVFNIFEEIKGLPGEFKSFRKCLDGQNSTIKNLEKAIDEVKEKLSSKPYLTVNSDVERVVGVGEKKAMILKNAGVKSVQELLVEDVRTIAEKTGLSENFVAKIQAAAKMMIAPGINARTVKTLQKVGVYSFDELACQSPIELYIRIIRICGKEMLSLDEVASCVRAAQRYTSKNFDAYGPSVLAYVEG